ncbi:unnamed protein product [Rhizoctonia solani]|uniref:rhamnogalacturonan endolyase n=1 Tax=Rhizoctonia solani TaxID=456999 RepID=A0A8H3H7W5_9AGAM|nr:unnamed protein product [Rhizoctonia solani]
MFPRILLSTSLVLASFATSALAAFGVTESGNSFIVDTAGGLVFTVEKTSGDITSMLFNGIQAQDQSKRSRIASGIGATCTWTQIGNYIKIPCVTSTLNHYYDAQYKNAGIHMATYTTAEPSVGELRFIARLNAATLPDGPIASRITGNSGSIEDDDVFLVSGQSRFQVSSSRQFIDDQVHGVTGSGIGAYMVIPGTGYETSSGGSFFRDINNQGSTQQELYFYMNSGHTQTEANRMDLAFWDGLGVADWLPTSDRGYVKVKASGVPSTFANLVVVGWSNSAAQYWARAESDGNYYSLAMRPGTYTMTMYKSELAVAISTVTVTTGNTITANIQSQEANSTVIWQIGDFDGTPRGFLNSDMIETMQMHDWLRNFTVGQEDIGYFPMAIFKDISPVTVRFGLSSSQLGARTLEIGVTLAFKGTFAYVVINGWKGPAPPIPTQPDSRDVTRGTWRGNNTRYTVSIPSGVLISSAVNVMTINVISGSSGTQYLSPNVVIDAVRLY